MKHNINEPTLQDAIDAAILEVSRGSLITSHHPDRWDREASDRLALARAFLARLPEPTPMQFTPFTAEELGVIKSLQASQELDATQVLRQALRHYQLAVQGKPEPTPPVVDGKTPGQVFNEVIRKLVPGRFTEWSMIPEKDKATENEAMTAVLAAFGGQALAEAQAQAADFERDAQSHFEQSCANLQRAEKAEAELAKQKEIADSEFQRATYYEKQAMEAAGNARLSRLRPIAEAVEVPADKAKFWNWQKWSTVIGWRYADESTPEPAPPPWQPAVGDVVMLKSGGQKMTVVQVDGTDCRAMWFNGSAIDAGDFYNTTLLPA